MRNAHIHLRYTVGDRAEAFARGISRLGFKPSWGLPASFDDSDILIVWNRINMGNVIAQQFQDRGLPVIVAENAAWGNDFLGRRWYSLARNYHNTAGCFYIGSPDRWDSLCAELEPFRQKGSWIVLPQRGIGSPPTRMPGGWAAGVAKRYGARIRPHPGRHHCKPLKEDLEGVGTAVTWGSGAAIKALMMGVSIISEMPRWIGWQDNTEAGRLDMFRTLAWAQWELHEIESGEAFACLLSA